MALSDRGLEVFLPTFRVQRRWSDRLKEVDLPLFPGYLFSRFDLQDRLPVVTAPGIVQIIGVARMPVPVPEAEIEAVRAVLDSRLPYEPWPAVVVGQRVLVRKGALAGIEGTLIQVKRRFRLLVSVELLQRAVSVEVEADWVTPLGNTPAPRRLPAPVLNRTLSSRSCTAIDALPVPAM